MQKVDRLTVYVLPAHKHIVEQLAEQEGESVGAIVRRLIRSEGERYGLWPTKAKDEVAPC